MSEKRIKLTDEHFALFQAEVEYWLDRFSLRNWDVYYGRIAKDDERDAFADCSTKISGRNACISLAGTYGADELYDMPHDVQEYAFHEVCELLLAELNAASLEKRVDTMVHEIIRRLEHAVFQPDWERRQREAKD